MNASRISNENPISAIISGVMRDAVTGDNRQAELTVALFKNEVTYSKVEILKVFEKFGNEKTDTVDTMIKAVSDEYEGVLDHVAALSDKKEKKTADALQIEGIKRKLRAARIMFERALKSVYWLRVSGCKNIVTNKAGAGALKATLPDPESKGEYVNETLSCNTLTNRGNEIIREALGKTTAEPKTKNPQANVLADASKALAVIAPELVKPVPNGKVQGAGAETVYDRLSDEAHNNLEVIFKNVFMAKFFDGNVFDRRTLDAWVKETFKAEQAKTAATNAGDKPKQEEQKKDEKAA